MADKKPRPQPVATPETQHFWDGCKEGKLLLQRCKDTGKAYFPPRPFSPYTGSKNVEVFEASGKGTLLSYMINQRQHPALDVLADHRQLRRRHRVVHSLDILFDDRPFIEIQSHIVSGGPNQLHSSLVGLVVGTSSLEAGKEGVVDVDDPAGKGSA